MKLFLNVLIIYGLIQISIFAQDNGWTTEFSDDGKTKVKSRIYESKDETGDEIKILEYTAVTKTNATLEQCAAVFNNPSMHKEFYDYTEISRKIEHISDKDWLIYYFYDPPWPLPNSDAVSKITMIVDSVNSKIKFNSLSVPDYIDQKEVIRTIVNDIYFTFSKIDNNEVEIFIEAIYAPPISAPNWMMNSWFPDGPAEMLSRFKNLAENNKINIKE